MSSHPIRRALISVYDKTGIVEFARALHDEFGIEVISTGGTAKTLRDAGIPVTLIEDITGFPELLDGRVKTLHPKIHAAILADRDNPEHMRQLKEHGIEPIDMVVVNLYPFEQTVADPNCTFEQAIEMIDIGGVTLLRAAAKNQKFVGALWDPEHYDPTLAAMRSGLPWLQRIFLGFGALALTGKYDAAISEWLSRTAEAWPQLRTLWLKNWGPVRYGENPQQQAELLSTGSDADSMNLAYAVAPEADAERFSDLQRLLSFNNYTDADAALGLCAELTRAMRDGSAKLCFASKARANQRSGSADSERGSAKLRFAPVRDENRSRRNLPHWQIAGATYWITYASRIGELTPEERDLAMSALQFWDGRRMDLHAAVVMPDHVHALLTPREVPDRPGEFENLSELLKSIKGFSGRQISKLRGGVGQAWVHESFDRWIRTEDDFREKWEYLANNIVKEGLAATPEHYRWWYANDVFGLGIGRRAGADTPRPPILGGRTPQSVGAMSGTASGGENSKAELCTPLRGAGTQLARSKAELCTPPLAACCFIKHTNPCGVGIASDPNESYRRAYVGDPNAAMGGILAVNFEVTTDFAAMVMETYDRFGKTAGAGGFFLEVWIAPSFDDDAVEIIRTRKKWGENVRLLAVGDMAREPDPEELQYRSIAGGMLVQTPDLLGLNEDQWRIVTQRPPTDTEMADLRLAWLIAKHTKSNAISICKDGMLIGNGAGQMSRVMSCRIATWLAKENGHVEKLAGSAAASDAFFPFRDGPDILIDAGVTAIIQPGGSKRDEDTIKACDERGVAMVFTGTRHFRH